MKIPGIANEDRRVRLLASSGTAHGRKPSSDENTFVILTDISVRTKYPSVTPS